MTELAIPKHVGIIVDGNGRWATEKGFTRSRGHLEGFHNLEKISDYAFAKGVKYLSVFVFSTENFKRSKIEVNYLMKLFRLKFKKEIKRIKEKQMKIVFSGRKEPLPEDILKMMIELEASTKHFTDKTLNICLNYGGIYEIIDASLKIHEDIKAKKIVPSELDEQLFRKYLYQDLPPIDFLIRTSGEQRISNFMLANLAYSELYFPQIYFPAFTENDFDDAIIEFNQRKRRYGGY